MVEAKTTYHPYLVLGLDTLISDPDILRPRKDTKKKADYLYIPEGYIFRAEDFHKEQSTRGEACKELLAIFKDIYQVIHLTDNKDFVLPNGTVVRIMDHNHNFFPKDMARDSSRGQAISIARCLKNDMYNVAIMTGNDLMSIVANKYGIDVAQVNNDVYAGRRTVTLPLELSNMWFGQGAIPSDLVESLSDDGPLTDNEYVEFIAEEVSKQPRANAPLVETNRDIHRWISLIGRYDAGSGKVVSINIEERLRDLKAPFVPRSPGQAMALDALLAPPEEATIVILSGIYGSGKTFLTTSAGILQAEQGTYDEIFVCPRDGALGKDIGFLPGDMETKIKPKMAPIFDNIKSFLKLRGDYLKAEKGNNKQFHDTSKNHLASRRELLNKRVIETFNDYFESEALVFMHGRNITDAFIMYDEFQDMERYQAKALLTRIGERSKVIITGDPEQRTNPYLNVKSNGLSYSASHLKGEPHTRTVTFTKEEIERSKIVRSIANYL